MSADRQHDLENTILRGLEKRYPGPQAFRALSAPVWRTGALSEKEKHLVAVAIAQITQCAFCIEHHTEIGRKLGATLDENLAASYISAALEAISQAQITITHQEIAVRDEPAIVGTAIAEARSRFVQEAFSTEVLSPGFRWLVAAAAAYTQANESHREAFHKAALATDIVQAALDEAYAIAVVLRSGAVYAHTLHVAAAYAE